MPKKAGKQQRASKRKAKTASKYGFSLEPIGDRILIELDPAVDKVGKIFLPDNAKEKPQKGTVIALGTGWRDVDGNLVPFKAVVGDRILVVKHSGFEIELSDGKQYQIIQESDVLGIIHEG